jgi:hypothetical protein
LTRFGLLLVFAGEPAEELGDRVLFLFGMAVGGAVAVGVPVAAGFAGERTSPAIATAATTASAG